jgi:hypothetical protein
MSQRGPPTKKVPVRENGHKELTTTYLSRTSPCARFFWVVQTEAASLHGSISLLSHLGITFVVRPGLRRSLRTKGFARTSQNGSADFFTHLVLRREAPCIRTRI